MNQILEYIKNINKGYFSGISTEHSYRGDLKDLISELVRDIIVTNEPKRQKCGAPDYIIQKNKVPIGYIEAKDILTDLDKEEKSAQMKRYLSSLDNLILTDYLEFRFFRYGQKVRQIRLGTIRENSIKVSTEIFDSFITYINDFCSFKGQTIKSSEKLARMMAQKARMMEEIIYNTVTEESDDNTLKDQFNAFKEILIHDLDEKTFADIYAQTIAYGLFAARLHDKTIDTFSREEALFLIPKSNPFLRKLFSYVAGEDLDDRVVWIVNDLSDILRATDVKELLKDFGTATGQNDPFLHFYETFLGEYDSALRKSRGVYYTPEPVVNFIVRAVDDILKEEFKIPQGLSDITKVRINKRIEGTAVAKGKNKGADVYKDVEVHKVQILDPATGTGTFLAEVVKHIYKKFKGQEGVWSNYVEEHLIPRLNGFEILMASYTMCHLKLEMLLHETGYKPKDENKQPRLRVFLTNSLEEAHPDTGYIFSNWLSREANEANAVKQDTPVMVVLGNPPYSVSSSNKSVWIEELMKDYKKDLNEKNIQPLSDDYLKFIRYGQHFIEKNGEGILAYISNNSFIDGIIHRQLRKNLLETFDKIYILDLHGNSKKKEICPDGSKDENVFDIMQGVSINIFIKTKNNKSSLAMVYHSEIFGLRDKKYNLLNSDNYKSIKWQELKYEEPYWFFVKKDFELKNKYMYNFYLNELFNLKTVGIVTGKDEDLVSDNKSILLEKYKIDPVKFAYRPFDIKYTIFDKKILQRSRYEIMKNISKDNLALNIAYFSKNEYPQCLISQYITCKHFVSGETYFFPLYLYPEDGSLDTGRTPNLNMEIVDKIAEKLGLKFTAEKEIPPAPFEKGGGEERDAFGKGGSEDEASPLSQSGGQSSPLSQRGFRGLGLNKSNPDIDYMPYNPELKGKARELRNNMTAAEKKIWYELLSEDKMLGLRFLRQKPITDFIVDFYCSRILLVIEVDGDSHEEHKAKEYDKQRTKILNDYGIKVLRYTNDQIIENLDWVAVDLKKNIEKRIKELSKEIPLAPFEKGGSEERDAFEKGGSEERDAFEKGGSEERDVFGKGGSEERDAFGKGGSEDEASPRSQRGFRGLASDTFAPIDILDYIYAVLHSPKYREKYKEFLKIDFPRVPYPENKETFWRLVKFGGEIRTIHLLENPIVDKFITTFPVNGDNKVVKVTYEDGKVWINKEQYFDRVPEAAWNFYIGGYQPAQKWLKDRKNRVLTFDDIMHYQKIVVALKETDRLMKEVDRDL